MSSTTIANLPEIHAADLNDNYITIVECRDTGTEETQHTTLEDLKTWLKNYFDTVYSATDSVNTSGVNLNKQYNALTQTTTISAALPEWSGDVNYSAGEFVYYNNCVYICLIDTAAGATAPSTNWLRLGYMPGRRIEISDTNEITSLGGIEVWAANTAYNQNDFVIKDKKLFQCLITNQDAEWDKDKWLNIGEGNGIIIYEDGRLYDANSVVLKDNTLYLRKTSGIDIEWNPDNWTCISNANYSNVFIKYSHTEPTSDSDMTSTPDEYLGMYIGPVLSPPEHYTQYTWYKIHGEDGQVNVECSSVIKYITIESTDWTQPTGVSYYTATFSDNVYTSTMSPIIDINFSNDATNWQTEMDNFAYITRAVCGTGTITFYSIDTPPAEDIMVKVRIQGEVNATSFVPRYEFEDLKDSIETILGGLNIDLETALAGE